MSLKESSEKIQLTVRHVPHTTTIVFLYCAFKGCSHEN
jgi:hypothetical protein